MATRITLDTHFEAFVQGQLSSGRYAEPDQVVREGLRLLEERERRFASLDASIARSRADSAAGRVTPADEVFDALEAEINALPDRAAE